MIKKLRHRPTGEIRKAVGEIVGKSPHPKNQLLAWF